MNVLDSANHQARNQFRQVRRDSEQVEKFPVNVTINTVSRVKNELRVD